MSTQSNTSHTASRLSEDHRTFEKRFDDLCKRAREGDWYDLDRVWRVFAGDVERHLALEETELFPRYCRQGADCRSLVEELVAQHREIRRLLEELGVQIQLKAVRAPMIEAFVDLLRRHAALENARIYPWAAGEELWSSA